MNKLLYGIKVVELTSYIAASSAGKMFAEYGAEVIKVEPINGDPFRQYGTTIGLPANDYENPCFQLVNSGKKSICINLKTEEGLKIFIELLQGADIFFTNIRNINLEKMDITYEKLKDKLPRLVYGHLSGYGELGSDANMPGFDSTAYWARGGSSLDLPYEGSGPLCSPFAVGDHVASLALLAGLLAALNKKKDSGKGEFVSVSLFGVSIYVNSLCIVPSQQGYAPDSFPMKRNLPVSPVQNSYICKDGKGINLTFIEHERYWERFCRNVVDKPEWIDDIRFSTLEEIIQPENNSYVTTVLIDTFLTETSGYWMRLMREQDLPFGIMQHFRDIPNDYTAWENGYLNKYKFRNGSEKVMPNTPIHFSSFDIDRNVKAPDLGEHTLDVLEKLEYSEKKIKELKEKKIIG